MGTGELPWLATPPGVAAAYQDWHWRLAYQYPGHSVVYRLARKGRPDLFLKLQPDGPYPSLADEAARAGWARSHIPVPEILGVGSEHGTAWMVSIARPGVDATHPEQLRDPERLTRALAAGLRRFHHGAPIDSCPFDFRLEAALAQARRRLGSGLSEEELDFHPEFHHLSPEEAMSVLESSRPTTEDLVVCHGDYCLPNVLIEDGEVTGYLDLGELGVACRWWDLATATWSLTWNLGKGFEELFLEEYGVNLDRERMTYYRLMYDAVS
jgi:aminoglycoside phosphotransferase